VPDGLADEAAIATIALAATTPMAAQNHHRL
jgi:hypothetical protein